jgi:lysophospholipase L1-like esterase
MKPSLVWSWRAMLACALFGASPGIAQTSQDAPFRVERGERIVFVGNTFAERMGLFPHFEALLTARFPHDSLTFRNLGWSADEVALMPRPLNFGDLHTHLSEQQADVIFAAFGLNESFAGEEGLPKFREDLATFLGGLQERQYNGRTSPRVVLVSPIAHERLERLPLDPSERNRMLALYTRAMRDVAGQMNVRFIDLFTPTGPLMDDPALGDLTINGIHLDDRGYWLVSRLMMGSLGLMTPEQVAADVQRARGGAEGTLDSAVLAALADAVRDKNETFFLRWRAVNGEYIYGRRREPFGVVNFPGEMQQLEALIRDKERGIWALAARASGTASSASGTTLR